MMVETTTGTAGEAVAAVAKFNTEVPVGSPIVFWPGVRAGAGRESVTRSRAWVLGGHSAVVMVAGYAGGIALTHVVVLPAEEGLVHG